MPELHPIQCTCRDCRNRRLIRDDDVAAERAKRAAPIPPILKPLTRARDGRGDVQPVAKL